jgi:hypothetical protein
LTPGSRRNPAVPPFEKRGAGGFKKAIRFVVIKSGNSQGIKTKWAKYSSMDPGEPGTESGILMEKVL